MGLSHPFRRIPQHGGPAVPAVSRPLILKEDTTMKIDQLRALRKEKYLSLTTFRRDGGAVATPVWFVVDGDQVLVLTGSATGKVKRIQHNPQVTVAACTGGGTVKGPLLPATASILPESAVARVDRLLSARYPVAKPVIGSLYLLLRRLRRRSAESSVALQITLR
jgi:PPOX class probable F420-dependent enzyme